MKKKKLTLLQEEDLITRIETQDEFIRNIEKEIFENINQVLCLARLKLFNIDFCDKNRSVEMLKQSGILIGKAISDLRNLAKQVKNYN